LKTIKEIAELAKVSPGTVDRVIHDRGGVSEKTRKRVIQIIEKYQYERNMIASTLAMKKKFVIGVLLPSSNSEREFWYGPKQGVLDAARGIKDYGFTVERFHFDQFDLASFLSAFDQLIGAKPDGAVITPLFARENQRMCRTLESGGIPYVFMNIEVEGMNNLSYIGQNSMKAGILAGKLMHLLIDPKNDIMIVRLKRKVKGNSSIEDRVKGFRHFFVEKKSPVLIHQIELAGDKKEHLELLTKSLLKNPGIKGIFVPSSFVNVIARYLNDYELNEIKLIGFDINTESRTFLKSGVIDFLITQKPFDQGAKAVKTLADYLLFGLQPETKMYAPIKIITAENVDFHQWNGNGTNHL
jgi:LacI family transcriptional regulator